MFRVFTSNRMEQLAALLALQSQAERDVSALGALTPVHVIVPHERIASYLKIAIARQTGLVANIHFQELHDFLADSLSAHDPSSWLLDEHALRVLVVEALSDTAWVTKDPALASVRRYMGMDDDRISEDGQDRRRAQLSAEIAALFMDYMATRASLLETWGRDSTLFDGLPASVDEGWQASIWRRIFDETHGLVTTIATSRGKTPVRISDLPSMIREHEISLPAITHVFGLKPEHALVYEIFDAMGRETVVFGYAFDPCEAFWEEMEFGHPDQADPDAELAALSSAGVEGGHLDYAGDQSFWVDARDAPTLLRLWGASGARHLSALRQVASAEIIEAYDELEDLDEDEPITLLERLQRDLRSIDRPKPIEALSEDDRSVTILAAPSIKREVEVVANEIWALLERNERERADDPEVEPLRFHDIAVLLPPAHRDVYQTHIRAVFPNTMDLPYNMVDMPAATYSRAVEAVDLLLGLPFGQFRRQELLRLLTHPNVLARFPNIEPREWLEWCDELRILHGADRRDHADTYIEGDLFHWDQGLKRLVLGAFMTGKHAGDRRAFHHGRFAYLPQEYGQSSMTSAARLVLMARSLIADAQFCRDARMPLAKWAEFFCRMVSTYLEPAESDDELNLHRCREQLAMLATLEVSDRLISYRTAFELARGVLADLEVRHGQHLVDGVVVTSMEPGRVVPFKVGFVMGMGEGVYPEPNPRRPEDLTTVTDREGDLISPPEDMPDLLVRDAQKWAFLEVMSNVEDALVLSFVSRDVQTGDPMEPSVVVEELFYALAQDYVGPTHPDVADLPMFLETRMVTQHELRRFHERYFPWMFEDAEVPQGDRLNASRQPEAEREARAAALRDSLEHHLHDHAQPRPTLSQLKERAEPRVWSSLQECLSLLPVPEDESAREDDEVVRVSTGDLRSFLECPLQGSARLLLRFDEYDQEDVLLAENEIFEASRLASTILLREVFLNKLTKEHLERRPFDFGPIYDEHARYFELEGLVPTGPFYRAARQRHLRTLTVWQENLPLLGLGRAPKMEIMRLGRQLELEHVDVSAPPLVVDVDLPVDGATRRVKVEISGRTESRLVERPVVVIPNETTQVHFLSRKYFVRGFLDHVVCSAMGREASEWQVIVNPSEEALKYKHKNCVRRFEGMRTNDAVTYLRSLLTDMLTQVHAYYMPVEAIFESMEKREPLDQVLERTKKNTWKSTSSDFGPVRNAREYPVPEDVEALARRRYGAFFDRVRS